MSGREYRENQEGRGWNARFSVLVISDSSDERTALRKIVGDAGLDVMTCPRSRAEDVLANSGPDVAVICVEDEFADTLMNARRICPETPVLIAGTKVEIDVLVSMIRGGACDFVQLPCAPDNLVHRLREAVRSSEEDNHGGERVKRLQSICKKLDESRKEISSRLDALQRDIESSKSEIAAQLDVAAATAAFQALVSQELGVEDVLRTALEYILSTTGPTNAAVFLANSETEYTLGAYVSYDCPRELADPVLARLGSEVCAHVAREAELVRFQDVEGFVEAIGPAAKVLQNSEVVAIPCIFEDECLAILFLFRDRETPFGEELAPTLDSIRGVFGEQLSTVVRLHHRIDSEWPDEPKDESDDSSDWGFGEGGMAA